jgi:hypothetical protein
MALYGVPYDMRPGQAPRDLVAAEWPGKIQPGERRAAPRKYAGSVPDDWVWLGSPGWWGTLSLEDQRAVVSFLKPLREKDLVPTGPNEWSPLGPEVVGDE